MTEDETKQLIKGLITSPSFLQALTTCLEQMDEKGETVANIGAWFFSQGYLACLEYMEQKDRFKSFSYQQLKKAQSYF